jgi:hypothetical protein
LSGAGSREDCAWNEGHRRRRSGSRSGDPSHVYVLCFQFKLMCVRTRDDSPFRPTYVTKAWRLFVSEWTASASRIVETLQRSGLTVDGVVLVLATTRVAKSAKERAAACTLHGLPSVRMVMLDRRMMYPCWGPAIKALAQEHKWVQYVAVAP